ncbi:DUF6346 domain-containing protein [Couchioplanes caeruleus]|uniref:Uncharacterized protein n=2 Tax=Couchioplanes caeruleus TaxID=56438 RepID=A0A1K0FF49_9ACTN|nr:DUF6346 domain-containing protein [Couchioplanes caeruleus]OJF11463.1 hypothetical protein BG844_26215 [Couchioplanes caeruleus subsp. caeruleus]ROP33602.1 hypothetical protein EDD30_6613 [Couchioplanes caeruleus]
MDSHDERLAKRAAEREALEAELDREDAERAAAAADPAAAVVSRREGSATRSAAFLIGIVLLTLVLIGASITLVRMAGRDYADAKRTGQAAVDTCTKQGPITNRGFGYWEQCTVTITWDDGTIARLNSDAVFTSADIGADVRVGDLGEYKTSKKLAREDTPPRPWLTWIGLFVGFLAVLPGIVAVLIIRELLRFRRR